VYTYKVGQHAPPGKSPIAFKAVQEKDPFTQRIGRGKPRAGIAKFCNYILLPVKTVANINRYQQNEKAAGSVLAG